MRYSTIPNFPMRSLQTIEAPNGMTAGTKQPYTYSGRVAHEYIEFGFISESYPADWTGRLKADAKIVDIAEPTEAEESEDDDEQ